MALTLAGAFEPFGGFLAAALRRELEVEGRSTDVVDEAVQGTQRMPAFPEAERALELLADAGCRIAVVSNSAREQAEQNLDAAGLRERVEVVVGADEVEAYKPDRRVYSRLLEAVGEQPRDVWLVAVHWWDVRGAREAGLRTGWVARKERRLLATAGEPDVTGADLVEVARAITS